MSRPRRYLPGQIWGVTRRCAMREFRMVPSEYLNSIVRYSVALANHKVPGAAVHALCFMSNHFHMLLTDRTGGAVAELMHLVDFYLAVNLKQFFGIPESFWGPGSYHPVRMVDDESVIEHLVYVLANPVSAELVRSSRGWPGVCSRPRDLLGEKRCVLKAGTYHMACGSHPEVVTMRYVRPRVYEELSDAELVREVEERLEAHEAQVRREVAARGRRFAGKTRVLKQKRTARPRREDPQQKGKPRTRACCLAALAAAEEEERRFQKDYAAAIGRYLLGERDVKFPAGTYLMRLRHGVRVRELDAELDAAHPT